MGEKRLGVVLAVGSRCTVGVSEFWLVALGGGCCRIAVVQAGSVSVGLFVRLFGVEALRRQRAHSMQAPEVRHHKAGAEQGDCGRIERHELGGRSKGVALRAELHVLHCHENAGGSGCHQRDACKDAHELDLARISRTGIYKKRQRRHAGKCGTRQDDLRKRCVPRDDRGHGIGEVGACDEKPGGDNAGKKPQAAQRLMAFYIDASEPVRACRSQEEHSKEHLGCQGGRADGTEHVEGVARRSQMRSRCHEAYGRHSERHDEPAFDALV